jgi:transglutaminase-like putative cysteine protease
MKRLQIYHQTEYRFGTEVTLLPHRLMLRPRESHGLRIASSALAIALPHAIRWQRDAFDNSVAVASFNARASVLAIESHVVIEHYDEAPLDFIVEDHALQYPFEYQPEEAAVLAPLRTMVWPDERPALLSWLRGLSLEGRRSETFTLLDQINRAISRTFRYEAREAPGVQSPGHTIACGRGSCRDFAALFLEACRHLGLASRFVSGYHTSRTNEVGAGATHAWAEVYLPGPGWKGFDPTAGVVTGSEHIAVAFARHPEAVPPIAGSFVGRMEPRPIMLVNVQVHPV